MSAIDLLGPASALNSTTTRPTDTRVFGTDDTWFKPCSAPGVQDGTQIQAVFLDAILAQLRHAIRGMGVTANNADDDMLLKAIQAQGIPYLIDTGSAGAMVVTSTVAAITSYGSGGMTMLVKAANAVTGDGTSATTINRDAVGAKQVVHPNGANLRAGDWPAGAIGVLAYDGTKFQLLSVAYSLFALCESSLTESGYQKLPGGIILQWGKIGPFPAEGGLAVTFPMEFPTACVNAQATVLIGGPDGANDYWAQVYSPTKTGMGVMCQQQGGDAALTYPVSLFWFAIGF